VSEVKAIVTGGAGFVPSHLVDRLLEMGNELLIIDNMMTGFDSNLLGALSSPAATLLKNGLKDCVSMRFEDVDILFHMAAYPIRLDRLFDYQTYFYETEGGTLAALEIARRNDIPLFVLPASTTLYGRAEIVPTPEDYVGPDPSFYGTSKYNSERWAEAYAGLFGIQVLIDRFGRILGSRSRNGAIWELVHKLKENPRELRVLGNGTQRRSFLHVDDCIAGIMISVEHRNGIVDRFNIANDDTASIKDVVDLIMSELNARTHDAYVSTKVKYGDQPFGWIGDNAMVFPDSSKLKSFGWRPGKTSKEAIRDCVRWTIAQVFGERQTGVK
jgi:UDP-glucose 4-epimerase